MKAGFRILGRGRGTAAVKVLDIQLVPASQKIKGRNPGVFICDRPGCVKMMVSLFSGILFSESLKLSRNHPEVFKLKTEVARNVTLKKNVQNFEKCT